METSGNNPQVSSSTVHVLWKYISGRVRVAVCLCVLSGVLVAMLIAPRNGMIADAETRTLHELAFLLFEAHRELRPNEQAVASHHFGLELSTQRANHRYATLRVRVGDDPRAIMESASGALRSGETHLGAIREMVIILEGFFSDHSGRKQLSFDYETGELLPGEKEKISLVLDEFNGFYGEYISLDSSKTVSREECVELWCDRGRKVSYALFPVYREYIAAASDTDLARISDFKMNLQRERDFTESLKESASPEIAKHCDDVITSIERRQNTLNALESWDVEALREILLDAIDKGSSKIL